MLTEADPFTKHLSIGNLDQGNFVLGAQSDDQLLISFLFAGLVQNAHVGLATIESLSCLSQTTGKTVVDQGDLQHAFKCVEDGHRAAGRGRGRNLNLIGGWDRDVLFSVRLDGGKGFMLAFKLAISLSISLLSIGGGLERGVFLGMRLQGMDGLDGSIGRGRDSRRTILI